MYGTEQAILAHANQRFLIIVFALAHNEVNAEFVRRM